jgi:hypothetical protein
MEGIIRGSIEILSRNLAVKTERPRDDIKGTQCPGV